MNASPIDWRAIADAQHALFEHSAHDFHGLVHLLRDAVASAVDCDRGGSVMLSCRLLPPEDDPLLGFRVLILAENDQLDYGEALEQVRKSEAYVGGGAWVLQQVGTPRAVLRSSALPEHVDDNHPLMVKLRAMGIRDALYGVIPVSDDVEVMLSAHFTGERRFTDHQRDQMLALVERLGPVARRLALSYGSLPGAVFSPRERQTLSWLLRGHSEKQISGEMGLSQATVHEYVRGVYRKLGVQSRPELMALWLGTL